MTVSSVRKSFKFFTSFGEKCMGHVSGVVHTETDRDDCNFSQDLESSRFTYNSSLVMFGLQGSD